MNTLAESSKYKIEYEYETVFLIHSAGQTVIGDFYGDPVAAVIDNDERWCAIVGCGLILYYLKPPFKPYEYDCKTEQWIEFYRTPPDDWWIEDISQKDKNEIEFVVDPASDKAGTYRFDTEKLTITKNR
jgi:hypothetical protein